MRSRVFVIAAAVALAGCGTGDGPTRIPGTPQPPPPTLVGQFVDTPVEGVDFATASQSGATNSAGEFSYRSGEKVRFTLGGILLGEVTGRLIVTPVELTGSSDTGTVAAPNPATRVMRFLQSIDADRDPANGITADEDTRARAAGVSLDFATASDAEVDAAIGVVSDNPVVGSEAALDHFYETYKALGGSNTFNWSFPGYPPFPSAPQNLLTNGGFEAPSAVAGDSYCSQGWQCFNEGNFTNSTNGPSSGPVSRETGTQSMKQYGFDAGIFQTVSAVPGANYTASVWAMNWTGDALNNLGILQLTFWSGPDGTGSVLGTAEAFVDPLNDGQNVFLPVQDGADVSDWTQISVSATAPPGTVSAKVLLLHILTPPAPASGTIRWDDARLVGPGGSSGGGGTLVWQEEFNSGTSPDPDVWTIETGYGNSGWGNDEWQLYTSNPANVAIVYQDPVNPANGYLRISALLDTAQCPSPAVPPGCGKRDGSITSARLISLPGAASAGKAFRYGTIAASIRFPDGRGSWPAFWMLGRKFPVTGWPKAGEIDIVENFNSGGTSNQEAAFALHWCDESAAAGQCSPFPTGYRVISARRNIGSTVSSGFHVYEAEWTVNGVVWRVDGVTYYSYPIAPDTMEEFLEEFFLLLNVAIGGNPVPAPDATAWPRTMLVDWIRLYQ
jgi:hypothetical protein